MHYGTGSLPPTALDLIAAVAGIFLLAGLWTPFAGTAVAMAEVWIVFSQPADPWTHFLLAILGASLALFGPGAWSVDARLFGRRIFVNRDRTRGES
jgi:putative oxidoreductase